LCHIRYNAIWWDSFLEIYDAKYSIMSIIFVIIMTLKNLLQLRCLKMKPLTQDSYSMGCLVYILEVDWRRWPCCSWGYSVCYRRSLPWLFCSL
jgi:hypothetical protein